MSHPIWAEKFTVVLAAACCLGIAVSAQSAPTPTPAFAAVSFKFIAHGAAGGLGTIETDPVQLHGKSLSLRKMILWSYDIDEGQLTGGEAWTREFYYSLDAVSDRAASTAELKGMLRKALADSFGLVMAHAQTSSPVKYLRVAKGGIKFRALGNDERPQQDAPAPPGTAPLIMVPTIAGLVDYINNHLSTNVPVVDATNLPGRFNIYFFIGASERPDGRPGWTYDISHWEDYMKQQLGLELDPGVAIVDHYSITAAHPVANN